MKGILIVLAILGSIGPLKAQDKLFSPEKFDLVNTYNSVEELYETENLRFISTISSVFLFTRSDSTFIAYWRNGYLHAFVLNKEGAIDPSTIQSIEFIDNNGANDLLVLKTYVYESQTSSAWVERFQNTTRVNIFHLATNSCIFSFNIEHHFRQTTYNYEEDITQEGLSKEELDALIESREEEVENVDFSFKISIEKEHLAIQYTQYCNPENDLCAPSLKEGQYKLINGRYVKQ